MNNMKKLIAALLVLTMVLALAGSAMAACKFKEWDCVKFTKNSTAYKTKGGKATKTIVRKGSCALVKQVSGKWAELYLDYDFSITRWFKTDNLAISKGKKLFDVELPIYVMYSQGGTGMSSKIEDFVWQDQDEPDDELDFLCYRISPDWKKHVKATASTWLHREPSLKKNYGRALHKGDKVKYRRVYSWDSRFVMFYGVKYKGKNLWVSSVYTELVK